MTLFNDVSLWSEIGEWAFVAEGGVVKMKQIIPPRVVVAGNPAITVRDLTGGFLICVKISVEHKFYPQKNVYHGLLESKKKYIVKWI